MSKELQKKLKPGDLIIATEERFFDYSEEVKAKRLYSQKPGDIIMVNNPNMGDSVGGTGITGVAHNGRPALGLGRSLKVGSFRMATPDDPGYIATKEQWKDIKDSQIVELSNKVDLYKAMFVCSLTMLAWVVTCNL